MESEVDILPETLSKRSKYGQKASILMVANGTKILGRDREYDTLKHAVTEKTNSWVLLAYSLFQFEAATHEEGEDEVEGMVERNIRSPVLDKLAALIPASRAILEQNNQLKWVLASRPIDCFAMKAEDWKMIGSFSALVVDGNYEVSSTGAGMGDGDVADLPTDNSWSSQVQGREELPKLLDEIAEIANGTRYQAELGPEFKARAKRNFEKLLVFFYCSEIQVCHE